MLKLQIHYGHATYFSWQDRAKGSLLLFKSIRSCDLVLEVLCKYYSESRLQTHTVMQLVSLISAFRNKYMELQILTVVCMCFMERVLYICELTLQIHAGVRKYFVCCCAE